MLEGFQEEVTRNLTLPRGSVFKSLLEQLGHNRIWASFQHVQGQGFAALGGIFFFHLQSTALLGGPFLASPCSLSGPACNSLCICLYSSLCPSRPFFPSSQSNLQKHKSDNSSS